MLTTAEYIEREALLNKLSRMIDYCEKDKKITGLTALFQVGDAIMDCPAADVAPVVHGRWIEPSRLYYGAKQYECSLCYSDTFWKKHSITEKYPHCPNCGCRMDGGDDE